MIDAAAPVQTPVRKTMRRMFSFPAMCVALIVGLIAQRCYAEGLREGDLWWHLANVRYLLQHHSLQRVDVFSSGATGSPWIDHEWLSEIPFYLSYKAMGNQGVLALYSALIVLIFIAVYYRCIRQGSDCKGALLATCLGVMLGEVSFDPRALLFGWLCMVALLWILDRFRCSGSGLWMVPPLFALWINLHGTWVYGIAVLLITIACGLIEGEWVGITVRRWTRVELRSLTFATAASLFALFINPFGFRLVFFPFELLSRHKSSFHYIEEWQPVSFHNDSGRLAILLVLVLLAIALLKRGRWQLQDVVLTGFALCSAFLHVRLLFFAGVVIPPIIGPRITFMEPYDPHHDRPLINAVVIGAIVAGMLVWFPSQAKLRLQIDSVFPTEALRAMTQQHISGDVFNFYHWGGYIEWTTPAIKPFVDGRADIFMRNGTFEEFFDAMALVEPLAILDKHHLNKVLIPPHQPLAHLLENTPGWHVLYKDDVAELLSR